MTEETRSPSTPPNPIQPVPPQRLTVTQRRRPNTLGCVLTLLAALICAGVLIGVGLFLPPVNLYDRLFGTPYVLLDSTNNAVALDGLTVAVDPADPGSAFGVALAAFSPTAAAAPDSVRLASAAAPGYLRLTGPIYDISTSGTPPASVLLDVITPSALPLAKLDVYGYDAQVGRWRFLPSQITTAGTLSVRLDGNLPRYLAVFEARAVDPQVVIPIDITQTLRPETARLGTIVAPAGLSPNRAGQLIGGLAPGWQVGAGYRVMPLIQNFTDPRALDVETITSLIATAGGRRAHAEQLAAVSLGGGFSGVFIDYRGLPASARDDFSAFVAAAGQTMRANGLLLGVVVPAASNVNGTWETGAYDWRAIGAAADFVQIELPLNPVEYAAGENRYVEALMSWAVREVSRYKLLAGLTALSVREVNGAFAPVSYDAALSRLGNVTVTSVLTSAGSVEPGGLITVELDGLRASTGQDAETSVPFLLYQNPDGSPAEKIWLNTPAALRSRLAGLGRFGIGGITLTDLAAPEAVQGLGEAVQAYRLGLPSDSPASALALRWRVQGTGGNLLAEVLTGIDEPRLRVTLEAPEGNYAINVEIVDGEQSFVRGGAQVALLMPTITPTPLPTATPTPLPTPTPTLAPIVPTQPAAGGAGSAPAINRPAVNPGPGSISFGGGFEYGGQVTNPGSQVAIGAMRQAGMQWMKVQMGYSLGLDPSSYADEIQAAKGAGFKVLLSVIGRPDELASGGGSYIEAFANFLGGVASYGPDAIEVWNEPNIDREWPAGQISGANYAAMLGAAYQRIKSANPGVMVISAAPAPTGAEAAFPGRVKNDDNWFRELWNAGGAGMMDCVGVHYNEGVVSPNQTSGDPRDNFPTRYFWTMISRYDAITGGSKPLCFTELGYVSPEGYGTIAPNFAWGANTTVAQQAAWLAEAIALSSQSGRVRLLIVWNIDFTRYDSNDPQGGYAIVRPGGGCPACAAIAAAR
jgi:hypothetical protein